MSSVPRLTKGQVCLRAFELLCKVQLRFGRIEAPPVSLDDVLKFLGLELEFDDLSARFGVSGHLGFTAVQTRQIFVDESLEPTNHPALQGRLNYTIAHEIAHWYLHRLILNPHLLSDDDNRWLERQCDWFASCL